jgi:hypothetical protein
MFKKGISGNPSGRPRLPKDLVELRKANMTEMTYELSKLLKKRISTLKEIDVEKLPVKKALALTAVKRALKGDINFFREIMDRTQGKILPDVNIGAVNNIQIVMDKGEQY